MTLEQILLIHLMEEAAEVQHRAAKALRFGLDEIQEGQSSTNAERLSDEFTDLTVVFELLHQRGNLPSLLPFEKREKRRKIERHLHYSKSLGILEE